GLFRARRRRLLGEPDPAVPHIPVPPLPATPTASEQILDAIPVLLPVDEPAPVVTAPEPKPAPLPPLPPPAPPRRPITRVLAAFMEEKNILWGELVGGLLIVGCSIALVLTLWKSLQSLPYFP